MDDETDTSRHPEAPRPSLRERLTGNRFLRGIGQGAVAVNGLLGQGTTSPPMLPPVYGAQRPTRSGERRICRRVSEGAGRLHVRAQRVLLCPGLTRRCRS